MHGRCEVLEADCLKQDVLEALVGGEVIAARIKSFVSSDLAEILSEQILSGAVGRYRNAPSIGRIGEAFYETQNIPDEVEAYFASASLNIQELRTRCYPYQSPIDLLRCMLDEVWPAGAQLESLYGRKMYVGLSRVVKPGIPLLAHVDHFSTDAPGCYQAQSVQVQLAANAYLSVPSKGGALQIWAQRVSRKAFDEMRGDNYGVEPANLGQPDLEITPVAGELVIFNSRYLHAVSPGAPEPRLSLSCFIGFRGYATPLSYWS